jgi:hypothetical protein|tara:strand:- start:750 stop:2837 length:2088 start_codon:yes stop_codon:yes gene_type:complete
VGKGKKKKQEPQQLWVAQGKKGTKIPIEQAKNPSSHEIAYYRTDKGEMVPIPNPHVAPGGQGFPLVSPAQFLTTGSALLPAAAEIGMTAAAMKYPKTTIALTGGALARGPIWNMIKATGRPVRKLAGRYAANVYPPDAFNKSPLAVLKNTPWRDQLRAFIKDEPTYLDSKKPPTTQGYLLDDILSGHNLDAGTYESYPIWRAKWGLDPTKEGAYGANIYSTKTTPANRPLNMEVQDRVMREGFYHRLRNRGQVPHSGPDDVSERAFLGALENYPMGAYGARVFREGYATTGSRGHAEGLAGSHQAALPGRKGIKGPGGHFDVPQYGGATGKPVIGEVYDWWDLTPNPTTVTGKIPYIDMVRGSLPETIQKGPLKPKHKTVQRIDDVRQLRRLLLQHTFRASEGFLRDVSVSARMPLRESGPLYEIGPYAMKRALAMKRYQPNLKYLNESIAKPEKILAFVRPAHAEHKMMEKMKTLGQLKKKNARKHKDFYDEHLLIETEKDIKDTMEMLWINNRKDFLGMSRLEKYAETGEFSDYIPKYSEKQRMWAKDWMEGKPMSENQIKFFENTLETDIRSIGTVADPTKIPHGARLIWGPEDLRSPLQKTNPFMKAKLRINNRVSEAIPYATMAPFLSVEGMRQRHETRKMPAVKATKEPSKPVVSRSEQIRKEIMEHKPFDMELRPLKQRKPAQIKRVK